MTANLKDKVALVTGGANGIGRAAAELLAERGATVITFDRQGAEPAAGGRAVRGDVSNESQIIQLFADIAAREKRLDVCVNCAGYQPIRPLLETTGQDLDAVLAVNVKGTFLVGREAARMMLRQPPGGRIINIASELAYLGRADYSAYCASKGAILSLTRAWARELAPHILVNSVAPGPTDTALIPRDEIPREVESVLLRRLAEPREIAAVIAFLAGPEATYVTGQCVSPNGGAVMF